MSHDDSLPSCAGVPFETVVAIHVSVASGLALEAALARHGLDLARWLDVDEAYAEHLSDAVERDGDLLDAHDRLVFTLRDAMSPPRAAAERDAVFALVREISSAGDPAAALAAHGITGHALATRLRALTAGLEGAPLELLAIAEAFAEGAVGDGVGGDRRSAMVVIPGGARGDERATPEAPAGASIIALDAPAPARAARGRRRRGSRP